MDAGAAGCSGKGLGGAGKGMSRCSQAQTLASPQHWSPTPTVLLSVIDFREAMEFTIFIPLLRVNCAIIDNSNAEHYALNSRPHHRVLTPVPEELQEESIAND